MKKLQRLQRFDQFRNISSALTSGCGVLSKRENPGLAAAHPTVQNQAGVGNQVSRQVAADTPIREEPSDGAPACRAGAESCG
ncbi:MAG: hypothetical protein WCE75_05600, partial [Terracidiphilus sp.]